MAVVCNNQVVSLTLRSTCMKQHSNIKKFYGVWGDTNGFTSTGEASISLGKLCFPDEGLNGDRGHDGKDVMFIGFAGDEAVPGQDGANWTAGSTEEFEESIRGLGDRLVAGLPN